MQRAYGGGQQLLQPIPDGCFGATYADGPGQAAAATQAICSNSRLIMLADLRLDNRADLLGRLAGPGAPPQRMSDCELVLNSWTRWGSECLDFIVGDYALAIFDLETRCLALARDPAGERPLVFVAEQPFRFASMPSGIWADEGNSLDISSLRAHASGLALPLGRTFFEGMSSVLPGQIVTRNASGALHKRFFWQPSTRARAASNGDLVEEYRAVLDEAVRCRLKRSAGPLGGHLSSGYDSSAVIATAARLLAPEERVIAFTSAPAVQVRTVPRSRFADESSLAAATARMHHARHVIVRDNATILSTLRNHARLFQEPVANVFNAGWWNLILSEAAALNVKVLLTGERGNCGLSAGGLPMLADWIRSGDWSGWMREARAAKLQNDVRWRGILFNSFNPWLPAWFKQSLLRRFRPESSGPIHPFVRRASEAVRSAIEPGRPVIVSTGQSAEDLLAAYRMTDGGMSRKARFGASGVEERDPTSDRRLIEFALQFPREARLHDGTYRPLARQALSDRLPTEVLNSRSRGLQGADWFARFDPREALEMLEDIETSDTAGSVLDIGRIRSALTRWAPAGHAFDSRRSALGRSLTNALSVGMFIVESERRP